MADTVIGTIEITETLIAIVRRVVGMRGTVIATEGTIGTGEIAGARPQPAGAEKDTRLNIGAEEATQGVHRGEEALAATGSQTVRVVPASPQQVVRIHAGKNRGGWGASLVQHPEAIPIHATRPSKCMPNQKTDNSTAMSSLLCFL